jgi:hypothetical protein
MGITAQTKVSPVIYAHRALSRIYQAWGIGRGMVGRRIRKLCCPCVCSNAGNGYGWLSPAYMKLTQRKSPWKNKHSPAPDCLALFRFSRMAGGRPNPLPPKEYLMIKLTLLPPGLFVAAAFTLLAILFARKITQLSLPGLNVQMSVTNAPAAAKQATGQPVKTGVPI